MITTRYVEKLRLALSTYQDGTGQLMEQDKSLPGWRDFERSVALAFDGLTSESKAIFDVLVPLDTSHQYYGISCKMRRTLNDTLRTGRVTLELSNSSGKFWDELKKHNLSEENYALYPQIAGKLLLNLVESWHEHELTIDLARSFYLLLQWDNKLSRYQLYQFSLKLPNPETLNWQVLGRRLIGYDEQGKLFEWYGFSGGQLKYYPLVTQATWTSEIFHLEPLPPNDLGYGLQRKIMDYFPELWQKTNTRI